MANIDKITEIIKNKYAEWEANPKRLESGYDYEQTFADMMQEFEKEVFTISLEEVPKDRNLKKKLVTRFGNVEICKKHILGQSPGNMNISSYAQETMCFVGQTVVFQEASSLIKNLTGANFNAKQIERVCHLYGGILEEKEQEIIESGQSKILTANEKEAMHYAMIDGAMYPTREKDEPWKEVKVGRIFRADAILPHSKKKNFIEKSIYVAHLGEAKDFFPKFEYEIEQLKNIVFINDGGAWIWKWVEENYPESTQILDFYHAKEHLCEFAKEYFGDEKIRTQWVDNQCKILLEDKPEKVIETIKNLERQEKTTKKREQLINYYTKHLDRMRYKAFKDKGLQIGSGAIEAAHKVYQQRFKLSGQHWSKKGLQKTIQLKSANQSNCWNKIVEIAKAA